MRACHRHWVGFVLGTLVMASPLSTGASLIVKMGLEDMAIVSEAVVVGVVRSVTSGWNATRTHVLTRVVFDVEKTVKGSIPPVIEVVEFGGSVDGMTVWVPGTPEFHPGERAVLLLTRDATDGAWTVTGFAQGKFRVFEDRANGQPLVRNVERLTHVYDPGLGKLATVEPAAAMPLRDFLERIRRLAAGERGDGR